MTGDTFEPSISVLFGFMFFLNILVVKTKSKCVAVCLNERPDMKE